MASVGHGKDPGFSSEMEPQEDPGREGMCLFYLDKVTLSARWRRDYMG